MTTRDPSGDLELRLAKQKAADFEWAFSRLVEVIAEEAQPHGPQVADFMLRLVEMAMSRVADENQIRQAAQTAAFNGRES